MELKRDLKKNKPYDANIRIDTNDTNHIDANILIGH